MTKELRFNGSIVGRVEDAFCSDGTWFGKFNPLLPEECPVRVVEFIDFCREWNAGQAGENPPDASAFDAFADMFESGVWQSEPGESTSAIDGAPNFFGDSEVSWIACGCSASDGS